MNFLNLPFIGNLQIVPNAGFWSNSQQPRMQQSNFAPTVLLPWPPSPQQQQQQQIQQHQFLPQLPPNTQYAIVAVSLPSTTPPPAPAIIDGSIPIVRQAILPTQPIPVIESVQPSPSLSNSNYDQQSFKPFDMLARLVSEPPDNPVSPFQSRPAYQLSRKTPPHIRRFRSRARVFENTIFLAETEPDSKQAANDTQLAPPSSAVYNLRSHTRHQRNMGKASKADVAQQEQPQKNDFVVSVPRPPDLWKTPLSLSAMNAHSIQSITKRKKKDYQPPLQNTTVATFKRTKNSRSSKTISDQVQPSASSQAKSRPQANEVTLKADAAVVAVAGRFVEVARGRRRNSTSDKSDAGSSIALIGDNCNPQPIVQRHQQRQEPKRRTECRDVIWHKRRCDSCRLEFIERNTWERHLRENPSHRRRRRNRRRRLNGDVDSAGSASLHQSFSDGALDQQKQNHRKKRRRER